MSPTARILELETTRETTLGRRKPGVSKSVSPSARFNRRSLRFVLNTAFLALLTSFNMSRTVPSNADALVPRKSRSAFLFAASVSLDLLNAFYECFERGGSGTRSAFATEHFVSCDGIETAHVYFRFSSAEGATAVAAKPSDHTVRVEPMPTLGQRVHAILPHYILTNGTLHRLVPLH